MDTEFAKSNPSFTVGAWPLGATWLAGVTTWQPPYLDVRPNINLLCLRFTNRENCTDRENFVARKTLEVFHKLQR